MYPTVVGAVVVVYNLPNEAGSDGGGGSRPAMVLDGSTLGRIFRHNLTSWCAFSLLQIRV